MITTFSINAVVVPLVNVSSQSEIADLHREVLVDQTVSGGEVTVNELLRSEVSHAIGDLDTHPHLLCVAQNHPAVATAGLVLSMKKQFLKSLNLLFYQTVEIS